MEGQREGWRNGGRKRKKIDGRELCEGEIMYALDE